MGQLVAASLDEDCEVESACLQLSYNPVKKELAIRMPTWIHDSHAIWVRMELGYGLTSGFFDNEGWERLKFAMGTSKFSPVAVDLLCKQILIRDWLQASTRSRNPISAPGNNRMPFFGVEGLHLPTIAF